MSPTTSPPNATAIPSPRADQPNLDRAFVRSIAWNSIARWTGQIVTWASTVLVARMLSPTDYGLVGMATVFVGLVTMLSEFGLGTAVVTLRTLDRRQIAQINTLSVLLGIAAFILTLAAANPLGRFFVPEVTTITLVLSVTFIVGSLRVVPFALLQQQHRFRLLSLIEAAKALFLATLALTLAWLGYGYWALVGALLGGTVFSACATLVWSRHSFAWPRLAELGAVTKFSWHVLVNRLSWYAYSNVDFVVAGRMLGAGPLGYYTMAWTTASIPLEKITGMITGVTPAFLASVQKDAETLRRYVLSISQAIALVGIPPVIGMALVAPDFIHLLLGERWLPVVAPLQLLCVYVAVRSLMTIVPQVLLVTGHTRFVMWHSLGLLAVLPGAFVIGSHWGTTGIAAAWAVCYPLLSAPALLKALKAVGISFGNFVRSLWPALSAVLGMAPVVLLIQQLDTAADPLWTHVAIQIIGGAVAFGAIVLVFHKSTVASVRNLIGLVRG
jgi:teichuronic acid exporter